MFLFEPHTKVTLLNSLKSDKYLITHLFRMRQSLIYSSGIKTRS
jgi:hypothetical protein